MEALAILAVVIIGVSAEAWNLYYPYSMFKLHYIRRREQRMIVRAIQAEKPVRGIGDYITYDAYSCMNGFDKANALFDIMKFEKWSRVELDEQLDKWLSENNGTRK